MTYYSGNGRFAVILVPEQRAGRQGDRSERGEVESLQPGSAGAEGAPRRGAHASFAAVSAEGQLDDVAAFRLAHEALPESALVADDGQYLVTDYGRDGLEIYRSDGSIVRSLALTDVLTPHDVALFEASSAAWTLSHIDEGRGALVLELPLCVGSQLCLKKPPQIAIRLADGIPLGPAKDRLPSMEPRATLGPGLRPLEAHPDDSGGACQGFFPAAQEVSFDRLRPAALVLPPYTEVARKARLEGSVVLELGLKEGAVVCVRTLKDLPMGLARAARESALLWRFLPPLEGATLVKSVVAVDFRFVEEWPAEEE